MERRWSAYGRFEETTMWYSAIGFLVLLTLSLLAAPRAADAQPLAKVHRIGVLVPESPAATRSSSELWIQRLHDLGYVEGQHFVME
jgi:hypothetical protein